MSDSVTVRSSQSWFGRIGGAIAGMVFGLVLFIAAFPVLTWNEGRAIHRAKTLEIGSGEVVSIAAAPVDPANDGKLAHLSGDTSARGPVSDTAFGVSVSAIKLRRNVEMYQWTESQKSETNKKIGGSEETVTTYTYDKKWSSSLIDSSEFHQAAGHANPSQMPVKARTFIAQGIKAGDFTLPDSMIDMIDDYRELPVTKDAALPDGFNKPVEVFHDGYYVGEDPEQPAVGDVKISFEVVDPGAVSIVARQVGSSFEPYAVKNLGSIEMLQPGTLSADSMFASEMETNRIITWLLRLAGFIMMFFGVVLLTKPLVVVADVIPFLGSLAGAGAGFLALAIALPLTLCTVALAWLAYRPLIGVPLLLLAVGSVVLGIRALRKKKTPAAAAV